MIAEQPAATPPQGTFSEGLLKKYPDAIQDKNLAHEIAKRIDQDEVDIIKSAKHAMEAAQNGNMTVAESHLSTMRKLRDQADKRADEITRIYEETQAIVRGENPSKK